VSPYGEDIDTDGQDVSATTHLQSGISSFFDMSRKGPRAMGRDRLRHLGKIHPRVKLISGMATTLPAPSASR
jgi:hypothetical protein